MKLALQRCCTTPIFLKQYETSTNAVLGRFGVQLTDEALNCCGFPLWGIDDDLSATLTRKKIENARASGTDYLCLACSYCQVQLDRVQKRLSDEGRVTDPMPTILFTELLGLSMGIDPAVLGNGENQLNIAPILEYLH